MVVDEKAIGVGRQDLEKAVASCIMRLLEYGSAAGIPEIQINDQGHVNVWVPESPRYGKTFMDFESLEQVFGPDGALEIIDLYEKEKNSVKYAISVAAYCYIAEYGPDLLAEMDNGPFVLLDDHDTGREMNSEDER